MYLKQIIKAVSEVPLELRQQAKGIEALVDTILWRQDRRQAVKINELMGDYLVWHQNMEPEMDREMIADAVDTELFQKGLLGRRARKATDRNTLIRVAASLPKGSEERRAVLAALQNQSK